MYLSIHARYPTSRAALSIPHLIPLLPIHFIYQIPPIPQPPQVLPHHLEDTLGCRLRNTAHMRRNQHIGRIPQRVIGRQRLGIGDVERSARNLLGLERLDQSGLVDDLPARDVRNVRARGVRLMEQGEFGRGEEV